MLTRKSLSCMYCCMKTVTLSESAYERLSAWKVSPKDSFSRVIERVVPQRGTMSEALLKVQGLPHLSREQFDELEHAVQHGKSWSEQRDPWTS